MTTNGLSRAYDSSGLLSLPIDVWKTPLVYLSTKDLFSMRLSCRAFCVVANKLLDHITHRKYLSEFGANEAKDYPDIFHWTKRFKLPDPDARILYGFSGCGMPLADIQDAACRLGAPWVVARLVVYQQRPYSFKMVRLLFWQCVRANMQPAVRALLETFTALRTTFYITEMIHTETVSESMRRHLLKILDECEKEQKHQQRKNDLK